MVKLRRSNGESSGVLTDQCACRIECEDLNSTERVVWWWRTGSYAELGRDSVGGGTVHGVIDFPGGVSARSTLKLRVQRVLVLETLLQGVENPQSSPAAVGRSLV